MEWLLLASVILNIWGYGEYRELETKHDIAGREIQQCRLIERTEAEAIGNRDEAFQSALESRASSTIDLSNVSDSGDSDGCLDRATSQSHRDSLSEALDGIVETPESE